MIRPPRTSTLFPYTTLFRSARDDDRVGAADPRLQHDRGVHVLFEQARLDVRVRARRRRLRRVRLSRVLRRTRTGRDRKSTRLNSSHANISYAVFCLKKKTKL